MELTKLERGTILLDASTVQFLSGHVIYHSLTGPYWADERVAELLRAILKRQAEQKMIATPDESDFYALTHALSFLEQWVLAEKLLVDRSAICSLADHNCSATRTEKLGKLSALYTEVDISEAIKKEAARHVIAFVDLMSKINNPLRMADFDDMPLKDSYYNSIDGNL